MTTYLVFIWMAATPAIWGGGYMEVESMEHCKRLVQNIIEYDKDHLHVPQTMFCTQHKAELP